MELAVKNIEKYHPNIKPAKIINGELGWGWISMVIKEIGKNERAEYSNDILILHEVKDGKRYFYVIRPADAVGESVIFRNYELSFVNTSSNPLEREYFLLRALNHLLSTQDDLRQHKADIEKADDEGDREKAEEMREAMNTYGLFFDYVPSGTWENQKTAYWRWRLGWGGPSDEIRFNDGCDETIEYVFLDWFEGVGIGVSHLPEFQFARDYWKDVFESVKQKAIEE